MVNSLGSPERPCLSRPPNLLEGEIPDINTGAAIFFLLLKAAHRIRRIVEIKETRE